MCPNHLSFSPSLFQSPTPSINTHTPLQSISFFSPSTPGHREVFDFLSSFLLSIPPPPLPTPSPPPLLLCAEVIVDAKGRGPRGSYQPITSVGVSGDEMERSRPAGGLDGSFNAERGVCKQTAADRVYACHNRSGPWSIFPLPFRSLFLSPLALSVSIFHSCYFSCRVHLHFLFSKDLCWSPPGFVLNLTQPPSFYNLLFCWFHGHVFFNGS